MSIAMEHTGRSPGPQPAAHREAGEANLINLRRLYWLRWILVAAEISLILVVHTAFDAALPLPGLAATVLALVALNLFTRWRLGAAQRIGQVELFLQLLADVAVLTAFLALTGGATNPFASFYLVPVSLAAAALPGRFAWLLALVSIACYSLLMVVYRALPLPVGDGRFDLHVIGMWLGFIFAALLVAWFVTGMGATLRRQHRQLAAIREQQVRDEQILSLGTLAASTAHELGTPLATLQLLVDELEEAPPRDPEALRRAARDLRRQLGRCGDALQVLSASAGAAALGGGEALSVPEYLARVRDQWQQRRQGLALSVDWQGPHEAPMILADQAFSQALNNILDNAADVSPQAVEWSARWDADSLSMEIRDRGPGLIGQPRDRLGRAPLASSKPQGLGLGVFLAHSVIARFGGQVNLLDRDGGGLITRIELPLQSLTTGAA